jgi:hypothetical protein
MSDEYEDLRETRNGYTIRVWPDLCPLDPRDCDNVGVMLCWHRRYELGDEVADKPDTSEYHDWGEVRDALLDRYGAESVILPLALLDHSGLWMQVGSGAFPCDPGGWDSGQVGFIIAPAETVTGDYAGDTDAVEKVLRAEVAEYGDYLSGAVYAVTVEDKEGNVVESIGGCIGFDEHGDCWALVEGRMMADAMPTCETTSETILDSLKGALVRAGRSLSDESYSEEYGEATLTLTTADPAQRYLVRVTRLDTD